jgi:hypothetical protein
VIAMSKYWGLVAMALLALLTPMRIAIADIYHACRRPLRRLEPNSAPPPPPNSKPHNDLPIEPEAISPACSLTSNKKNLLWGAQKIPVILQITGIA